MTEPDLIEQLTERAQAVQTVVTRLPGWADAVRYAVELTVAQGGSTLAACGLPPAAAPFLEQAAAARTIELLVPPLRRHLQGIHTGLTGAAFALAETATLVLDATSEDLRIATMLSETHVAVIPAARVCPDTLAVRAQIDAWQQQGPRYVSFISGASRTADIERVLTIGVHGPQHLHLVILEEDAS